MSCDFEITVPTQPKPKIEYSFQIDCRENTIVGWYKKSSLFQDIRVNTKRLDTGDFIFFKDNKPFVCIERKRIDDFASSIRDGRYKTQKLEMIEYANKFDPPPHLVYLVEQYTIENDMDAKSIIGKTNITKETVLSAITKTMFRDGFQIVCTTDVQDSIRWLLKMWENLCNGQFEGYNTDESYDVYYKNVSRKLAKRSTSQMKNIDRDGVNNWWMLSLANINGISISKAQEIVKKYPTVKSLLSGYSACKSKGDKAKMLGNLRVNTRRIGDAASRNVYQHITGDRIPTKKKVSKKKNLLSKPPKTPKNDFSECMIDSDSEGW